MRRNRPKGSPVWIVVAISLWLSPVLWAQEEFQARILPTEMGISAYQARKIKITVNSYSSREEILELMDILSQKGFNPFMSAFIKLNKGSFRPIGGRGIKINLHAVHSIQTDQGRKILLFTQRQSWDADLKQSLDRRFLFMVIELKFDNTGKGEGKIYEEARIRLTPLGTIEMESYNSPPRQLFDVRALKK